jgi:hypothetical protein
VLNFAEKAELTQVTNQYIFHNKENYEKLRLKVFYKIYNQISKILKHLIIIDFLTVLYVVNNI